MPVEVGLIPVRTLVLDGLHKTLWQYALVNVTPIFASRSKFGVFACGCPPSGLTQSFKSSTAMKRMLGRLVSAWVTAEKEKSSSNACMNFFMNGWMLNYRNRSLIRLLPRNELRCGETGIQGRGHFLQALGFLRSEVVRLKWIGFQII